MAKVGNIAAWRPVRDSIMPRSMITQKRLVHDPVYIQKLLGFFSDVYLRVCRCLEVTSFCSFCRLSRLFEDWVFAKTASEHKEQLLSVFFILNMGISTPGRNARRHKRRRYAMENLQS